jgi:hypothetical protein
MISFFIRLPYEEVRGYVYDNWRALTTLGQCMPAYIQLDHVYGLAGFDLNMSPSHSTYGPRRSQLECTMSEPVPVPVLPSAPAKTLSAFHYMFPTKRPRFIVQR